MARPLAHGDQMEDLIESVSKYDPAFKGRIVGASADEVTDFQKAVGQSLPTAYKTYLRHMGKNDGGLRVFEDCDHNVRHLWAYYREVANEHPAEPAAPEGCAVVAFRGKEVEEIYLGLGDKTDGPLYWGEDWSNFGQMATSFSKRLEGVALWYSQTSGPLSPFRMVSTVLLREPGRLLKQISRVALAQGFERLEFSDSFSFCGKLDDAVVMAHQWEKARCRLAVASGKKPRTDAIVRKLTKGFSASPNKAAIERSL